MIEELTEDPKTSIRKVPAAVVCFYAPWCGDCKLSAPWEAAMEKEFVVPFYRLDADELEPIADRYEVESYPTYVFFRKGKPLRGALVVPVAEGQLRNWLEIKLSRR
jgi:thiol-disulfide isomerase/thioredoxin